MTVFARDTFTEGSDTALTSHTPDVGTGWTDISNGSTSVVINAANDRAYVNSNNTAVLTLDSTPGGPTYTVTATYDVVSSPSSGAWGVACRASGTLFGGNQTGYFALWIEDGDVLRLQRGNAGSFTTLDTEVVAKNGVQNVIAIKAETVGATVEVDVWFNGALLISYVDSSGSRITAAGEPAIQLEDYNGGNVSNGWHLTLFEADDDVPDVAPTISDIDVAEGRTIATVTWTTDEAATSRVYYGTVDNSGQTINDGNVGTYYASSSAADAVADNTSHSVGLTGLTPSTVYYGRVRSADTSGPNVSYSSQFTWTQLPPDIVAPVVSNVYESAIGPTVATLVGTTDEAATSEYRIGTATGVYGAAVAMEAVVAMSHDIALTGLTANTAYYWQMRATDESANTSAWSTERTFTTTPTGTLTSITPGAITLDGTFESMNVHAAWSGAGSIAIDMAVNAQASANAAAGATSISVLALKAPVQTGMQFLFANGVTATLTANAATSATAITVSALSGAVPSGTVGICSGLRFRVAGQSTWRQALPPVGYNNGTDKVVVGKAHLLAQNTTYQIEITYRDQSGGLERRIATATTRAESEIGSLYDSSGVFNGTATHYLSPTGNDALAGTSSGTAWKTIEKALFSAPSGAVVRLAPGSYDPPDGSLLATARTLPITLVAQYAAVDTGGISGAVINAGNHSIIRPKLFSVPTGQSGTYVAPWTNETVAGVKVPGNSYTIRKWDNAPVGAFASDGTGWMVYASSPTAQPRRVPWWIGKDLTSTGYTMDTGAGFAEVLSQNDTNQRDGFRLIDGGGGTWDIWAKFPNNENPNDYYVWFQRHDLATTDVTKGGWGFEGANQRVSGVEFRGNVAPDWRYDATYGVMDRCLLYDANSGTVGASGDFPRHVVYQYNKATYSGLWSESATYPSIGWIWVKNTQSMSIQGLDTGRIQIGQANEYGGFGGGQGQLTVFRHNRVGESTDNNGLSSGGFNGFGVYNTGQTYLASYGVDIHDSVWYRLADDALEPEQICINWSIWNCRFERNPIVLSQATVHGGPTYLFRNVATDWSNVGVTATTALQVGSPSSRGVAAAVLKYSGNHTSGQQGRIYFIHNTFHKVGTPEFRITQTAGGSLTPPDFWIANNIMRTQARLFTLSTNPRYFFEDYNILQENPNTGAGTEGHQMAGGTWKTTANLATYRTNLGTTYTGFHGGKAANTNKLGATNYAFNSTAVADAALPNANVGTFTLQSGSALRNVGMAVPNISDLANVNYEGTRPDLGYAEFGLTAPDTTAPAAPTSLGATGGTGQIVLDWADNAEADLAGYNVYEATSGGGPFTKLNTGGLVAVSTYTRTGLAVSTQRFYQVTAVDASGNESQAATANATTLGDVTGPVISAVSVTAITSTTAIINWTTDEPATSRVAYGLTAGYGSLSTLDAALKTTHAIGLTGLTQSTLYHYRPVSADAATNSTNGSDGTFTTIATPDSAGPVITDLLVSNIGQDGATVTWTTDEQANERVEYRVLGAVSWTQTDLGPSVFPTHSRAITGLLANTEYEFQAISIDPTGNSTTSDVQTFRTLTVPVPSNTAQGPVRGQKKATYPPKVLSGALGSRRDD